VRQRVVEEIQDLGAEPALEASYSAHGATFQLASLFMPRGVRYGGDGFCLDSLSSAQLEVIDIDEHWVPERREK